MNDPNHSRPTTPLSPLTSSLYHATSTIDDLTAALANFSRVPSPEPFESITCCCGREDCENLKTWLELKARLGSRLILSAEVGQALLQRHAAYVRQSERTQDQQFDEKHDKLQLSNDDLRHELEELLKEKAQLERRLNQALVNNEVTEVSNKTILNELQEARETISRLTAHHARSVGWDMRLSAAMKERDDMQQERDGETHRARLAESRFAALKEKTAKLQTEVRRLQDSLESKRNSRLELSESILQEARSRLDSVKTSQFGLSAKVEQEELAHVIGTLVQDNDSLKHDNAELQHLLAESREDLHALQEEVDEQRANMPITRSGANTPNSRHFHTGSVPSISFKDYTTASSNGRSQNSSIEGKRNQRYGTPPQIDVRRNSSHHRPLTPDTLRSPLSDPDSLAPWSPFARRSPRSIHSHVSYEIEADAQEHEIFDVEKQRTKSLLLLSRSRGVQTDASAAIFPSLFPSHMSTSTHGLQSESSSFSENNSSHISTILDRAANLLNRLSQADALTLTNRLKRQNLKGAHVGHLSRSTVSTIIADATSLRGQFRGLLEDEKMVTVCTRKDLRMLFKFFKDAFTELGQLRVTVNDIVLDPSLASRISELALNPGKAEAERLEKEREVGMQGGVAAWMAPISKLFSPTGRVEMSPNERSTLTRSATLGNSRDTVRPARFVPKLGPALAASATTVNVEFSGTGVGRAVTSTFSPQPTIPATDSSMDVGMSSHQSVSSSFMGIFAGAPIAKADIDPWVVIPTAPSQPQLRKSQSFMKTSESGSATATIGRNAGRKNANRLSRNVDAVIDVDSPQDINEEPDYLPPLLERTLRRRGLSDSSIHSTFTNQGEDARAAGSPPSPQRLVFNPPAGTSSRLPTWADRTSVFQALSRTVQNFRSTSMLTTPTSALAREERSRSPSRQNGAAAPLAANDGTSQPSTPTRPSVQRAPGRVLSPGRGRILPDLASWASEHVESAPDDPFIASSLRDESYLQRRGLSRSRAGNDRDETHTREFY